MTPEYEVASREASLKTEMQHREEICETGRRMYAGGYVVANEGNLSVRFEEGRVLMTPSGVCKGRMEPKDLLITDLSGQVVRGEGRPSSEMMMHLLYYRARPDVRAVCHAHPPTATGFAAARRTLGEAGLPNGMTWLGTIGIAPYATPGTEKLSESLEPLVKNHDAVLLENHGVVTCGEDLGSAYLRMEAVEHFARVMLTAESFGGARVLPRAKAQKLMATKRQDGTPSLGILELRAPAKSTEDLVAPPQAEFVEETLRRLRARR